MSLTKKYLKSRPVCKVTFRLSADEAGDAQAAAVLGDFNDWDPQAGVMKRLKSGDFTVTLEIPSDSAHHFRYCIDGDTWLNDAEADGFERSPLGAFDNSIVRV